MMFIEMMFSKKLLSKLLKVEVLIVLLSALSVGCESSDPPGGTPFGTGPANPVTQTLAGNTPYLRTGINGSLTGEIWSAAAGTRLNLETGEIKTISEGLVFPSTDGREYAELINDFQFYPQRGCGGAPIDSNAIFIRDSSTSEVSSSIEVFARLAGPVLISPDGETLALFASSDNVCGDQSEYFPTLMSRDGEVISVGSERVVGFDWMPDNRLAFMVLDNGVYKLVIEIEPNTFSGFVSANLRELDGFASRFRVSPDGEQVLIEVVTELPPTLAVLEYREATVWQVNIDGSNLQKLADTSRASTVGNASFSDPLVNQPVWSPDGLNMLVTENYLLGASIIVNGTETENLTYIDSISIAPINQDSVTYVMPASTPLQRLPPASYSASGVRPLFTLDAQGKNGVVGINPIGRQVWTPPVVQAASMAGAFPASNGRVNRNLSGTLYTHTLVTGSSPAAPISTIDLASDELNVIGLNVDDTRTTIARFDVSVSGQRIAALHSASLGDNLVNVYNASGALLQSYSQVTSRYDYSATGAIQISTADENRVAWLFRSESGDEQGVVVLDVDNGRFVDVFDDRDYDGHTFMPNGDLLLVDANRVFLARTNTTGFASPTSVFDHSEHVLDVVAQSNGQQLAFSSLGGIYTIDADGSNFVRVTAPSSYFYSFPAWSPDGQYLLFRGKARDSVFQNSTYFVSADAKNVGLYGGYLQNNIMQLSESSTEQHRIADRIIWR